MATLSYEGFNNIPATDIKIDPSGYNTAQYTFDNKGNDFEVLTVAQLKQRLVDLGINANITLADNVKSIVYTGAITAGQKNDLGSFSITFKDKATDALGNKYDVKIDYKTVIYEPLPTYELDFFRIADFPSVFRDLNASQNITGADYKKIVAGDADEVEISVLQDGATVSKLTTFAFLDIDTRDEYNYQLQTPSDTGNKYFAGNGKVWEYQESVNPMTSGTVYVDPDTCEILDGDTGFIGNACSSVLDNNLISSIAFNSELPHTVKVSGSGGAIAFFSDFTTLRSAKVTASKIGNGTITEEGDKDYLIGSNATYTMTPAEGYRIKDVKVDGTSVGAVSTYTFTDLQADHAIEVEFEKIPEEYIITATADNGGAISDAGETTVTEGDSKTYTITPDEGYVVKDVLVDGVSVGAVTSYTFSNVDANHTIHATFEEKQGYTITTTVQGNGTVTMDGESAVGTKTVPEGSTKTLNINPKTGHKISAIILDGESITPTHTLVLEDINEDHTVVVTFRKCTNADIKPDICGGEGIYIDPPVEPEEDCCKDLQEQVDDLYATKQDVLTAGENITIEDGVISATFSFDLFEIVDELPETGDPNKVYLVPTEDGFEEWHYKNGKWDPVGSMHVDLTGYVKEEDVTKEYLLTKLGYEEIEISKTDSAGKTVTAHVLGWIEEPEPQWVTFATAGKYSGNTGDGSSVLVASNTITEQPPDGAQVRCTIKNLSVDGGTAEDFQPETYNWSSTGYAGTVTWPFAGDGYFELRHNGELYVINENWDGQESGNAYSYDSVTFEYLEV